MTDAPGTETTARDAAPPLVVALDIGSSSVRVGLYDAAARRLRGRAVRVSYAMDVDVHGGVSIAPDRLLDVVASALDAFHERAGRQLDRAVAVGVSCFLHSLAAVDDDGRALSPLLSWADTTSAAEAATLRRELDEPAAWRRTGAPLHASYWPAKMRRLRAAAKRPIRAWRGAPELVFERLCGAPVVDVSSASGSGLIGRADGRWDDELLAHLGMDVDALPTVSEGDGPAVGLEGDAAARWPRLARLDWFPAWSDASCSNVGLGCLPGGPAALVIGTSGAMRVITDEAVVPMARGLFGQRLAGGRGLIGGQLSEGGAVAAWAARLAGASSRRLEAAAARLAPDGHGLTVLPYLAGERGPGYHDGARGVVAGLSLRTDPAALYRALLEAVALRFRTIDGLLAETLGRVPEVVTSGGALTASPLWTQLVADALGRDVRAARVAEASERGAAIQALVAAGVLAGPDALASPATSVVHADRERAAIYAVAAERQAALYDRLIAPLDGSSERAS